MRKRRSTVYVCPGKDVTLYIPTETPPEVIDYLNGLKKDGFFSQGVMEIVTWYVRQQQSLPVPGVPGLSESLDIPDLLDGRELDDGSFVLEEVMVPAPIKESEPKFGSRLQMAHIFKQARHNAGKLIDSSANTGLPSSDES